MFITDYIVGNAQKYPHSEAIVNIDANNNRTSMSWEEFDFWVNKIANFLIDNNINKGDKMGILLSNSLVWLPIYFGILKSGAVAVLLNYNNSIEDLEYCIELANCKGVFISYQDKCYSTLVRKNIWLCGIDSAIDFYGLIEKYPNYYTMKNILPDDGAAIYFSSGTTGHSKAILISHKSLDSAAKTELSHHKQCFNDRFLCLSPLYHTGAKIHWFGGLIVGSAIVLYNSSMAPRCIMSAIENERISIAFLLVPHIQDIIEAIDLGDIILKNINLTRWRLMHSGAQNIPKELINRWQSYFPTLSYDTSYGLTEATGPGCISLGMGNICKIGSIGKPSDNWSVDIVDREKSILQGEVGELIIKGPGVMLGYYNDEKSTKEVLVNGWLYTGDMAYMDEDGYIYISGRKKDVIISGGENIYPAQIENFYRKLPYVRDVAIIGLPNPRMGELVVAVIEFKDNYEYTKKELLEYSLALPAYQRPYKFLVNKIIRNSLGKIDKKEMRKCYLK